jgi:hypothetical protein
VRDDCDENAVADEAEMHNIPPRCTLDDQ